MFDDSMLGPKFICADGETSDPNVYRDAPDPDVYRGLDEVFDGWVDVCVKLVEEWGYYGCNDAKKMLEYVTPKLKEDQIFQKLFPQAYERAVKELSALDA